MLFRSVDPNGDMPQPVIRMLLNLIVELCLREESDQSSNFTAYNIFGVHRRHSL